MDYRRDRNSRGTARARDYDYARPRGRDVGDSRPGNRDYSGAPERQSARRDPYRPYPGPQPRRSAEYARRTAAPARVTQRRDYPPQRDYAPRRSYSSRSRYKRRYRVGSPLQAFLRSYSRQIRLGAAVLAALVLVIVVVSAIIPDKDASREIVAQAPATQQPVVTQQPAATQMATPTPVPTATPAPVAYATMSPTYEITGEIPNTVQEMGLPKGARADDSYFNDTVFIGDSVSEKLKYFVTNERKNQPNLLGNAKFLTAPSFSARNALKEVTSDSLHPTYQGEKMKMEDVVARMGVKKVYIMLGLNDVGIHGVERSAENMMTLLRLIREKSPDVQIFVQSATPRLSGNKPTTNQLFGYNLLMYDNILKCGDPNIYYVDVAHVMRDAEGKLIADYCSDADSMALHFNNTACREWVEFLYTHALTPVSNTI